MGMGLPGMGGGSSGGGGLLGGLLGGGGGGGGGLIGGAGNGGTLIGQNGINLSGIPFIGGMFPNPNEGAARDAMNAAGQAYGNMRPQMAQGYQNMVSQFQNQMSPASQALANMYGGQHGQNSDVTGAMAAQNQMSQAPGSQGPNLNTQAQLNTPSRSTASDRTTDDGVGNSDPLMSFVNTIDPLGGLGSIGGSFGGLFGLNGGSGGPMGAVQGATHGGGLLGGLLGGGGGGLGGLLGGLGGGGGLMGL